MSRHEKRIAPTIVVCYGSDHALGSFFDVIDERIIGTDFDMNGEGFVHECSNLFGVSFSFIGLTMQDAPFNNEKVIELCNKIIPEMVKTGLLDGKTAEQYFKQA